MAEKSNYSFSFKDSIKFLLIAISIFLISLLLPGDRNEVNELVVGSAWQGEDIISDKVYTIEKDQAEINKFKAEIEEKYHTLLKYEEADVHEIGAKVFEGSDKRLANGVLIKNMITSLYKTPVRPDLAEDASYYILENDELVTFKNENTQSLTELKDQFKRDMIGNSFYSDGIEEFLTPNYILNTEYQEAALQSTLTAYAQENKSIAEGEVIIKNGDILTTDKKLLIDSYLSSDHDLSILSGIGILQYLGYLILTSLIIIIMILFLREYYPHLYENVGGVAFVLFWPVVFGIIIWLVKGIPALSPFMIPFCVVPIVVNNFFTSRLALFIHIIVVLIASYLTGLGYEFTFIQILAGVVTVLLIKETRHFNKFFIAVAFILATYALGFLGINLIQAGEEVVSDLPIFAWLLVNGLLLLIAYPLIPLVERLFGFTSSISLVELSDMNNPLLKELATRAPGTLQHSLQVANLAEAATDAIDANSVLVRTAALYHDIGKLSNPAYFIENNSGNNMHQELNDNFESARIIIGHVTEGVKMAKKAKLPKEIIKMIKTHHGNTRVEYFYRNQKAADPDREFDESIFRYPGPRPTTKEESILLIADSIEAACKSLKNPTHQELDEFVDKIVQGKIDHHQLSDSELSFKELETVVETIKSMLYSIYHIRIQYPDEKK